MTDLLSLPKKDFEVFDDITWMRRKHPDLCLTEESGEVMAIIIHNNSEIKKIVLDSQEYGKLKYLNLADNGNLETLVFAGEFPDLAHLDASNCGLKKVEFPKSGFPLLKQLYLYKNQLTEIDFNGNFGKLELIDLNDNELENSFVVQNNLSEVAYLYLNQNQLDNFDIKAPKSSLNTLGLEKNEINTFDPFLLPKLPGIENIYLSGNPLEMSLEGFAEGQKNYLPAIVQKRDNMQRHGSDLNYEYKVLLVGNGNVGKSTLVHRLTAGKFLESWNSTHGISLTRYPNLEKDFKDFKYRLNLWDFGGQEIYHATHRMFMKSNAIYLLLWDMHTEVNTPKSERPEGDGVGIYLNHPLNYWMNYIQSFGKNSPIVLIRTKIDENDEKLGSYPNEVDFRKKYRKDLEFLEFDLKDNVEWKRPNGVHEKIRGAFKGTINCIGRKENLPKNWIQFREVFRKKQEILAKEKVSTTHEFLSQSPKTMKLDEYFKLATKYEIEKPIEFLENWLVKTGVVFFRKGYFDDQIILDQEWAIRAVYSLFDPSPSNKYFYNSIQKENGKFSGEDLAAAWNGKYNDQEQELFIGFMLAADLCFETTKKENKWDRLPLKQRTFIAPEFLNIEKPKSAQRFEKRTKEKLFVEYRHETLHYGIMQSFIVRTISKSKEDEDVWKYGIILTDDQEDQDAIVEMLPSEDSIRVQVGKDGRVLLNKIRNMLDELQIGQFEEWVSRNGEDFVKFEVLQAAARKEESQLVSDTSKIINVTDFKIFTERDKNLNFLNTNDMEEIRNLIASGRVKTAIERLTGMVPGDFKNQVDSLSSRYYSLQQKINIGTISQSDQNLENNKIVSSLLELISSIQSPSTELPVDDTKSRDVEDAIWDSSKSLKVLFLASNPGDTGKLALNKEFSKMVQVMQDNDSVKIHSKFAVSIEEMNDGIIDNKPVIVHFSGHGTKGDVRRHKLKEDLGVDTPNNDAGLIFHDDDKYKSEILSAEKASAIFKTVIDFKIAPVKMVVLNNCYSEPQAVAISKLGLYVLGISEAIIDTAAIQLTRGVYRTIASGDSLNKESLVEAIKHGLLQAVAKDPKVVEKVSLFYNGIKIILI
jgi:GTPase SAR1 family protein